MTSSMVSGANASPTPASSRACGESSARSGLYMGRRMRNPRFSLPLACTSVIGDVKMGCPSRSASRAASRRRGSEAISSPMDSRLLASGST
ncbi:hypothetical protein D3C78_1661650 [compost metagenome]